MMKLFCREYMKFDTTTLDALILSGAKN